MPRTLLLILVALVSLAVPARAAPLDAKNVPDPLKPWTRWALAGSESATCPGLAGQKDQTRCTWPSRLELGVEEKGGRFTQKWHVDAPSWASLPGDDKRWPLDVKIDGVKAVVIAQNNLPSVHLDRGDHTVTGSFAWDSPPESLPVPLETGLLALTLRGVSIASPLRDAQGAVFLQKTTAQEEGEKLEILAHRKITDDIPLTLTTHLELDVAGKSREVLLGKALPSGFVPMSLDTQLPARIEDPGRMRVQVRPGRWTIDLVARSEGPIAEIARPAPEGPWREGEEVWVFEAKTDLRLVDVHGPAAVDPAQTSLPDAWKTLPAYPMKVGDKLTFEERRRGDAQIPPDQLQLKRTFWLDFDGAGWTVSDSLNGTLNRDTRLEMAPPFALGRVAIGGRDQFITHIGDASLRGVEVRQGPVDVTADSRVTGDVSDVPAVGWKHDFHQVSGTLHLPPGWRLLHASGVDDVPNTWLHNWSLLQIFLALILSIAVGRLYGWRWGLVTCAMLALTLPEPGAPRWIWLFVLAGEALVRVLPDGRARGWARGYRAAMIALTALVAIPFLVAHVQQGMYPVLANDAIAVGGGEEVTRSVNGDMGLLGMADMEKKAAPPPAEVAATPQAMAPAGNAAQTPEDDGKKLPAKNEAKPAEQGQELMRSARPAPAPTGTFGWGGTSVGRSEYFNTEIYDPNAIVQTGPGLPHWAWSTIPLSWSGPVAATQHLKLWLVPPSVNFTLAFVRLVLVLLVLLRLLPHSNRLWPRSFRARPAVAAAALAILIAPSLARAQSVPDKATLDELRSRLLARADCEPDCASSGRLAIELHPASLRGRMEIDAASATAVPLPGTASQWLPDDVAIDGQPAKALLRTQDGTLWVAVPSGSHQVAFEGRAPQRDSMQLPLHLKPHRVEVTSDGWEVAGVHEDGIADQNLQFTRIAKQGGAAGLQPGTLPPFVRVERTISAGLNWQADTRVVRLTAPSTAVVLEVPLLPGESVTTADVRVAQGKAQVNMPPGATEIAWHSVLEQRSPLKLVAPKNVAWTEVWRIDVGPIWHASFSGIPVVHVQPTGGARALPEWRPWPGEEADIDVSRPDGVAGQSLTIDSATMDVHPGVRATDVTLTLSVRSSRGATHVITLPNDAQLESMTVNAVSQPVRQEGRKVTIAIVPGAQTVTLSWRQTQGSGVLFRSPEVDLGAPSVNATVTVSPGSRWVLFAGGPRVGPAVLFWSALLVMLCVAALLARVKWTPLKTWHWLLLAIGLSQVDIVAGALFAGWLLALGWRKERPEMARRWFNARQVLVVIWTIAAMVVIAVAISQGLLGSPAMQVSGNQSTAEVLRWYSDRSGSVLPVPWVITVPMFVYRLAMLAWALWVAIAIVRWMRFGWGAFTTGGMWMKPPPPPPPPPPPVQPPYRTEPGPEASALPIVGPQPGPSGAG